MPTISVSSTTKLTKKTKKTNTNCSCFLHLVQQQTLKKTLQYCTTIINICPFLVCYSGITSAEGDSVQ